MADAKISALTDVVSLAFGDLFVVVDVSDTTDAASGTTKKATGTELFTLFRDTDGTLAANSDSIFATQKAVKTYVDAHGVSTTQADPALGDLLFEYNAAAAANKATLLSRALALNPTTPGGRLTFTTGVPWTTSDVTGATTIYYTPAVHNGLRLWDGTRWVVKSISELSLALGTVVSGRPYDVFVYDSGSGPTLELLAWTNTTTRATGVSLQDGVYCKTGDKLRLYLGTFIATSTTTAADTAANPLYNMYNRRFGEVHAIETAVFSPLRTTTIPALTHQVTDTNTSGTITALSVDHELSTGTAATNMGVAIDFFLPSTTTVARQSGRIATIWTTATDASRASLMLLGGADSGSPTRFGIGIGATGTAASIGFLANVLSPVGVQTGDLATATDLFGLTTSGAYDASKITNTNAIIPAGTVWDSASLTTPSGWLTCDGTAVSRTTYASLFAAVAKSSTVTVTIASPGVFTWNSHGLIDGDPVSFTTTGALPTGITAGTVYYVKSAATNTFNIAATVGGTAINTTGSQSGTHTALYAPYGRGDGSTTFNVPDFRGKVSVGTGTNGVLTLRNMAATGGEETHTQTIAEMPAHQHNLSIGNRTSTVSINGGYPEQCDNVGIGVVSAPVNPNGSGNPFNVMQPFLVTRKIIKT